MNDPADTLRRALSDRGMEKIDALVVLGSGMSGCFGEDELDVVYTSDEGSIAGHHGRLALLSRPRTSVLVSLGRRHLYEGLSVAEVTRTVRLAALLGAQRLVLTNAAGGLNPTLRIGDVLLITDALGVMLGKRAAMNKSHPSRWLFDQTDYARIERRALDGGISLKNGTYASVLGPSYETRAEIRMLRRMGADAVGMSTLVEAAAGCEAGMSVVGISLITNMLGQVMPQGLGHEEVVERGVEFSRKIRVVVEAAVSVNR